jgi:hypothetical protein
MPSKMRIRQVQDILEMLVLEFLALPNKLFQKIRLVCNFWCKSKSRVSGELNISWYQTP